eukprot:12336040-Alexandrium_andersonii.AAC.1
MSAISGTASPESAGALPTQQHLGESVYGVVRGAAAAAAGAAGAVVAALGRANDGVDGRDGNAMTVISEGQSAVRAAPRAITP